LPASEIILAGEPGGEDVDRRDRGPVDGADVAEVGDAAEAVGQDGAGVPVDLGVPGELSTENGLDGDVEAAVAGAQGSDARALTAARWTGVWRVVAKIHATSRGGPAER
jgi:hypothetical protein